MANWASTSYRIEGKQEDLKTLNELINEFMDGKRPVMEDNASKDWEGNVALELGENTKGYYLRGFIQTCELEDDVLSIEAEEAWGATDFRHILEKHFEGMKVYFIVEEEGGEALLYKGRNTVGEVDEDWQKLEISDNVISATIDSVYEAVWLRLKK